MNTSFKFTSILMSVVTLGTANALDLRVNVGPASMGTEPGFTNWVAAERTAPEPITVDGVELFYVGGISDEKEDEVRSLNRPASYSGPLGTLTRSWWGARLKDQRAADGPPYDSGGFLTLGINGSDLGAGTFIWTSWHHDHNDQVGYIDIDVSLDGGETFVNAVREFRIVNGNSPSAPNPASFSFVSNGEDDIHIRFTNVEVITNTHSTIFALVNGFSITRDPSLNLVINPAIPPATGFDLEWNSKPGMQYALRTRDNLDAPASEWDILVDAIPATPPMNKLNVQQDGPRRFFVIEESEAAPLFTATFEQNGEGFVVLPGGTGSQWQHGMPDSEDAGGGFDIDSGNDGSQGAWGVNLDGPYESNTETVLQSPVIDLGGLPEEVNPVLNFALALDMNLNAAFEVRVVDGASGDPVGDPLLSLAGNQITNWQTQGPFALPRQAIRIEWAFTDPDDYPPSSDRYLGAYIDDVEILVD